MFKTQTNTVHTTA